MKYLYLLFLCSIIHASVIAQVYITDTVNFRYKIAAAAPDSLWMNPEYDDSSWAAGCESIGYGYGTKDSIVIDPIVDGSLLIRYSFDVPDITVLTEPVLLCDYDDAFIAYINGVEVARANLGKKGEKIVWNRLSDRSKESYLFNKFYNAPVPGIALDLNLVKSVLKKGRNVLSVQVHNDSIQGSDLTFLAYFYNLPAGYYNTYQIDSRYFQQIELESSKLPIVQLFTDEFGMPRKSIRYMSEMKIVNNKSGINKPDDPATDYNGFVHAERRGKSSSDFAKFSFNVETVNKDTNSIDTAIMGMPRDNDWILIANFADKSLIRNEICFELGRRMGHYEPRTKFCELMVNGQYQGLYLFAEKIKRGKNRVYVAKKPETGTYAPEEIGYVFKFDKNNHSLQFVYPDPDNIPAEQTTYIADYFKEFYNVLGTPDFNHPEKGYKKYIEPGSLIDFLVVNELAKNADSYLYSTYLYKEGFGSKVKYGPLWDYDLGFGNTVFQEGDKVAGWQFNVNKNMHIHQIMKDSAFADSFEKRWTTLRQGILKTEYLFHLIDSLVSYIEESRIKNYQVWHTIDKQIFYPGYEVNTYDEEIAQLKSYIQKRSTWIDQNIGKLTTSAISASLPAIAMVVYPNPVTDKLNIKTGTGSEGEYRILVSDMHGRQVLQQSFYSSGNETQIVSFGNNDVAGLKQGIYFVNVIKDGRVVGSDKFVKTIR